MKKMKKTSQLFILLSIFACSIFLLLTGCARTVSPAEVLQIPEHASVRTAYNLWYLDPMEMDTLNYLQGSVLPFGTEVFLTRATDQEICFRTAGTPSKEFRIHFSDQYRFQSVEDYIRELFTTKTTDDLTLGIRPITIEKLKRGIVEKGMTRQEVALAFGPPCAFKTPATSHNTWVYWTDFLVSKRVIFNKGKVMDIFVLE